VEKLGEESPTGKIFQRWEDNVDIDVENIWWNDVEWVNLAHDMDQKRAALRKVIKFRVS
jgi:hypothetical protein